MLVKLPPIVLDGIVFYLNLEDVVELCSVNTQLTEHLSHVVWRRDLLFPAEDRSVTELFVKRLVRRIPRSYGVLEMRLINLPLSWQGLLLLFDHFGHSVGRIHLVASAATLAALAKHLAIFAGNLVLLQRDNKIPITFREYCVDQTGFDEALVEANYLGHHSLTGLGRWLGDRATLDDPITLDDPPFERLEALTITSVDTPSSSSSKSSSFDHENSTHQQIYYMVDFLAGGRLTNNSNSDTASKRRRCTSHDNDPSPPPKHRRATSPTTTSASPYHHPPSASAF